MTLAICTIVVVALLQFQVTVRGSELDALKKRVKELEKRG